MPPTTITKCQLLYHAQHEYIAGDDILSKCTYLLHKSNLFTFDINKKQKAETKTSIQLREKLTIMSS